MPAIVVIKLPQAKSWYPQPVIVQFVVLATLSIFSKTFGLEFWAKNASSHVVTAFTLHLAQVNKISLTSFIKLIVVTIAISGLRSINNFSKWSIEFIFTFLFSQSITSDISLPIKSLLISTAPTISQSFS